MNNNITSIILAGGKSSRMGKDKGLLQFKGQTLIERTIQTVQQVCNKVIIIANQKGYAQWDVPVYKDIIKNKGPVGGIHAGLSYSKTKYNLVVGCDMPFLSSEFLKYLIGFANENYDVIIPQHKNKAEPLCAIYSKNCLLQFEKYIQQGQLKMQKNIEHLRTKHVDVEKKKSDFNFSQIFKNINTPQELEAINIST